jgi:lipoprotein signal peptidase
MADLRSSGGDSEIQRRGRRWTDGEPNRGWRRVAAIALAVAVIDWGTKWLVTKSIPLGDLVVVAEGRVALWHVRNPAMILGLFGEVALPWRKAIAAVLALLTTFLLVAVVARSHRLLPARRPWAWLFAGLLAGGMLGNLGERVLHWWVTDFLSFGWGHIWLPPGNIADLSIVSSIPIAVLVILFEVEARSLRRRAASDPAGRFRERGERVRAGR